MFVSCVHRRVVEGGGVGIRSTGCGVHVSSVEYSGHLVGANREVCIP